MKTVNQSMRKKDAMQLVTGQPVYMDDVIPQDCLIVKLLRSPHANAIVQEIDTSRALLVPGIEAIYTWKDVDQQGRRYTQAGQTYPEPSPYDRLVIDRHVRFAGDVVAILAGKDEKCVDKAMKLIKVRYEVLPAVLDYHTALDNPVLVHPEENWESLAPVGADNKLNAYEINHVISTHFNDVRLKNFIEFRHWDSLPVARAERLTEIIGSLFYDPTNLDRLESYFDGIREEDVFEAKANLQARGSQAIPYGNSLEFWQEFLGLEGVLADEPGDPKHPDVFQA